MSNYKQLDYDIVKEVAEKIMDVMGYTTNLDVKNELRAMGYWATQALVAALMQEVADNEEYNIQNTGNYNIYKYKSNTSTIDDDDLDDEDDDDDYGKGGLTVPKRKKGTVKYPTHKSSFTNGDWEVYSVANSTVAFYPSTYTRDEVRKGYALEYNVHFHDTRSKRVK